MAQPYKPFEISDFKEGLVENKEPWLKPRDAFSAITNAFIKRGVVKKRLGYTLWHKTIHLIENENIADTTNPVQGTLSNIPLREGVAGSLIITDSTGSPQVATDDGAGGFTGDVSAGTIDYTTGVFSVTFNAGPTGPITADYKYHPGLPVMGIESHYTVAGGATLIMFDTKRSMEYDTINDEIDEIGSADVWTGSNSQFFWTENWKDRLFVLNNSDVLKSYNGTSWSNVSIDFGGGAVTMTALMIFVYKDRLVVLRTTEDATVFPQRARWCSINDPDDWTNDGWVDAPTVDFIITADFLGDDLVVWFERSVWMLKYTGDVTLPFRWEKIVGEEGSFSTFGLTAFSNEQIAIGPTKILSTDKLDVVDINRKIPDIVLEFNPDAFEFIYSTYLEEEELTFISYPSIGVATPDRMLVLNSDNNSWSIYKMAMHCFGFWAEQADLTWDDIDETWDEIEWSWDDKTKQAGYPITFAGDLTGNVYKLNDGGNDNGSTIEFEVESKKLNPYIKQGLKARLGWIDFLFGTDGDTTLSVEFYLNQETTPYQTLTLTLSGIDDKVWKRLESGAIGQFHRIIIKHDASGQGVDIHSIVPYFKPVRSRVAVEA